jgi:hypothetical protein
LAQHGSRLDREVEAVRDAVTKYGADIDAFFATLDRETDPVAIAQQASQRPAFPDLGTIGASVAPAAIDATAGGATDVVAEPTATDEPSGGSGVGVMADPATLARGVQALTDDLAASRQSAAVEPAAVGERTTIPTTAEAAAVVAATRVSSGGSTPVLQSVPISRPMSWLRRDRDQDRPDQ